MPWDLIRTLIIETYGGKIDDESDYEQLSELVKLILTPEAFENDHILVKGTAGDEVEKSSEGNRSLMVPEGNEMGELMEWVNQLPEREPPTYLGLPANAEKVLLVEQGRETVLNVAKITEILDESEQLSAEGRTSDE